jgi:hypothetical protein
MELKEFAKMASQDPASSIRSLLKAFNKVGPYSKSKYFPKKLLSGNSSKKLEGMSKKFLKRQKDILS